MGSNVDPVQYLTDFYLQQIKNLHGGELPKGFGQSAQPESVVQQSPAVTRVSKEQELLLGLYDEFANTDDGKALAANLGKFARFVQSKVAVDGQQKSPQ